MQKDVNIQIWIKRLLTRIIFFTKPKFYLRKKIGKVLFLSFCIVLFSFCFVLYLLFCFCFCCFGYSCYLFFAFAFDIFDLLFIYVLLFLFVWVLCFIKFEYIEKIDPTLLTYINFVVLEQFSFQENPHFLFACCDPLNKVSISWTTEVWLEITAKDRYQTTTNTESGHWYMYTDLKEEVVYKPK